LWSQVPRLRSIGWLGIGVSYRMWTDSGVDLGSAVSAMAATTVMSLATLFVLPVVALFFALVGAPTPRSLSYWLSLPVGLVGWWMFRRRYPTVPAHSTGGA
jgi:hypothetical protein